MVVERRADRPAAGRRRDEFGGRRAELFARYARQGYARGGLQRRDLSRQSRCRGRDSARRQSQGRGRIRSRRPPRGRADSQPRGRQGRDRIRRRREVGGVCRLRRPSGIARQIVGAESERQYDRERRLQGDARQERRHRVARGQALRP